MKRLMGVLAVSMMLCAPAFAASDATTAPTTPVPPGLEKQGKTPPGLEKHGKTPKGWSKGKAGWKHPGQTPTGSAGNHGSFGGGNSASHGHSGHGHK